MDKLEMGDNRANDRYKKITRKSILINHEMPPKKIFFKYNQEDVYKAIEEIQVTGKIRETCRKYNISHSTIINKLKMRHPLQRKMGPPTILTPEEEKLLCKWINASAKKGIPLKKEQLLDAVQNIIKGDNRPNPFKGKPPGRKWFSGFLKRNPDIAQRHAESINSARSRVTEKGLRRWHSELKEFLISQDAQDILEDPDRILNCDESGFRITPDSGLVLGPRGMTNFFEIRDKEKESITVLGTFAASGKLKLVLVIYPYDRVPAEITRNFPENWCIGKSPKGWMTSRVFYGYIGNSLIPALHEAHIKFPVLLLVDGHKSHISYEVSQLCHDNQIILYALHPNATHIIQPADVSVFRPLKHAWKSNVQKWKLSTGNRVVTRAQFAPLLKSSLNAATNEVIRNGFRKCGLFPFDADAIDYTKCMSDPSRHDVVDKPAELGIEHLLYFESLMSRKRVAEFRAIKEGQPWVGEESAKELYDVWCKVYKTVTLPETLQSMEKTSNSTVHDSNNAELRNSETDPRSPLSETGPIILDSMSTSRLTKDSVAVNHTVVKTTYDAGIPDSRTPSPSMVNYPMDQDLLHVSPSSSFLNFLETTTRNSVYMTPYNCAPADLSPEPLASGTVPETGVTDLLQRRVIRPSTPMNLPDYSLQKVLETTPLKRQAIITKGVMPETSKSKNSRKHSVVISELLTDQDFLSPSPPQRSCPSKVRNDEGAIASAEKGFNSIGASSLKPTSSEEPPAPFSQNPLINESYNEVQQTTPKIRAKREMPISPAFASAVIWPTDSPLKKGGKTKTRKQRFPDAITSPMWNEYWKEKEKEKEEKEKRKLAREEKLRNKENIEISKVKTKALVTKRTKKRVKPSIESSSEEEDTVVTEKRFRKRILARIESDSEEDDIPLVTYKSSFETVDSAGVGSYVIIKYEGEYFPGVVKNIRGDSKEVSTMVLASPTTFKWPEKEDKLWYDKEDIIETIKTPIPMNTRGSFKVEEMAKYLLWV